MKVWANTIVNNEENFIWFAVMSVIDHVDKVLIYDTGSTDKTVEIIQEIKRLKGNKIDFREVGEVDKFGLTKMRQQMLEQSDCDWILILDGDEIWWDNSIKKIVNEINLKGDKLDGIVVPVIVSVGDIYHFQEESAGRYEILGRKGHYNLRAIRRNIPGLHADFPHPNEGYLDINNKLIQESKELRFLNTPYLHVTHLKRSSLAKEKSKIKYELGISHAKGFKYPEILYQSYPKTVPSPWKRLRGRDLVRSIILTPLRQIKRRVLN